MATRTLTSGVPTMILNPNAQRRRLVIQVLSTNVVAGNTGRVHLGYDFQPQTAAGNPAGGDILTQGAYVDKNEGVGTLAPAHKGQVWANAQVTDMVIDVAEDTDSITTPK